jgi:hypothetical protein
MPDTSGKMYLQDYVHELKLRGFDGFTDADLGVFVTRGYHHVARKHRWLWEKTVDNLTMDPGTAYVDLWPTVDGELPFFRSIDKLYLTGPDSFRKKLKPMGDDEFFTNWLFLDLTAPVNRGEPAYYKTYEQRLYILPPPVASRDFIAHYFRRVQPLVLNNDQPITPQHLDEAIIQAALIRCHQRANEPALAAVAQVDLESFFDDMREDEEREMTELTNRVKPDDSWL